MLPHVRASVAYIVGRIVAETNSTYVYDYSSGKYIFMSGTVGRSSVAIYDHENDAHISGTGTTLYHHGENSHLTLSVATTSFTGFDYASNTHFSGNVNGRAVSLYDYEHGAHFNYLI